MYGIMKSNRYFNGHIRLQERECRRMKQGGSSVSYGRMKASLDSLHSLQSLSGRRDHLSSHDRDRMERIRRDRIRSEEEMEGNETPIDPRDLLRCLVLAVEGLIPSVETISIKRGGAAYQVPIPIPPQRGVSLAIRWLIQGSKERRTKEKHRSFAEALVIESLYVVRDLSSRTKPEGIEDPEGEVTSLEARKSYSRGKKLLLHRMAKSNRVFAHLRWR